MIGKITISMIKSISSTEKCLYKDFLPKLKEFYKKTWLFWRLSMPNPTAIIQTERLILRQWCDQDIDPYIKLNADPRVMEFFPDTWRQEESDTSLQTARNHIEKYGWGKWAVSLLETDEFIGRIGLEEVDFQASFSPKIELGYRIA